MKLELSCVVISLAMMSGCASAPEVETAAMSNKGMVTVAGLSPSQALAAIDTSKLVKGAPEGTNSSTASDASTARSDLPNGQNAISIEGVKPSDVLAAIDTSKLVDGEKKSKAKKPS
ncbi:MAG TPA: hypothetical protein VGO52_02560 [Hyphomonadaceae bacterium]|jgi:hypothetical protein|nr:hypothetical protein [Hyphomonadaceae bacterium]